MKFKVMLLPYLLNLSKLINKQNFEVIKVGNYAYCVKVFIICVIKLTLIFDNNSFKMYRKYEELTIQNNVILNLHIKLHHFDYTAHT